MILESIITIVAGVVVWIIIYFIRKLFDSISRENTKQDGNNDQTEDTSGRVALQTQNSNIHINIIIDGNSVHLSKELNEFKKTRKELKKLRKELKLTRRKL